MLYTDLEIRQLGQRCLNPYLPYARLRLCAMFSRM